MAEKQNELKLIRMDEVETTEISWLWYQYIPFGKITVIQGDPGDGKTTVVLAIAATVTTGAALPETGSAAEPMSVIFRTAEGGLGDTVKPRLVQSGADCERVIVIDDIPYPAALKGYRVFIVPIFGQIPLHLPLTGFYPCYFTPLIYVSIRAALSCFIFSVTCA